MALTGGVLPAHAASASSSSDKMQVSVQVVRACVVDTNVVDAAVLLQRTQGLLAASCGAEQVSVTLAQPSSSTYLVEGGALWLDVEF